MHPLPADAIDGFVVERLREATADGSHATKVETGVTARLDARRAELAKEHLGLPGVIANLAAEGHRLVDSLGNVEGVAQRLVDEKLQQVGLQLGRAEASLAAAEAERALLDEQQLEVKCLTGVLRSFADIFDLERAPEPFLDTILQDLGDPFLFDLDVLGKRRLASVLVEMYRQKGRAVGIENAIRLFLGIDVAAITPFAGTTLVVGESELGVDWVLGPSDRFARYAFNVEVALTDTERRQIRAIVDYLKPAHNHFVDLIEPGLPPVFDHWELGISELGWTTDLH